MDSCSLLHFHMKPVGGGEVLIMNISNTNELWLFLIFLIFLLYLILPFLYPPICSEFSFCCSFLPECRLCFLLFLILLVLLLFSSSSLPSFLFLFYFFLDVSSSLPFSLLFSPSSMFCSFFYFLPTPCSSLFSPFTSCSRLSSFPLFPSPFPALPSYSTIFFPYFLKY